MGTSVCVSCGKTQTVFRNEFESHICLCADCTRREMDKGHKSIFAAFLNLPHEEDDDD